MNLAFGVWIDNDLLFKLYASLIKRVTQHVVWLVLSKSFPFFTLKNGWCKFIQLGSHKLIWQKTWLSAQKDNIEIDTPIFKFFPIVRFFVMS